LKLPYIIKPILNLHTSALKMEAECSFETSVSSHKATQCHSPEVHNLDEETDVSETGIMTGSDFLMDDYRK
jgi:hypothetical protein